MPYLHFPFFYQSNSYIRYPSYSRNHLGYSSANLKISDDNYTQKKQQISNINSKIYSNNIKNEANFDISSSQDINIRKNPNAPITFDKKNNSKSSPDTDSYFFELFGLRLYFDDVLLICLIFFLYEEGVKDDELFLSLILLLLS